MAKLLTSALVLLLLSGCGAGDNASASQEVQQYSIAQFMGNTNVRGGSFSQDRPKLLVRSDRPGIFNAYAIDLASGETAPLIYSDSSSGFALSYFPGDDRFLFQMDDNGNEIFHLFVQDGAGQITELTPDANARAMFLGWAADRNSFFLGYSKRDPRLMDLYEMDLATLSMNLLYANDQAYVLGPISPDKKQIVLAKPINTNDNQLFVHNLATGQTTEVSNSMAAFRAADFSKDGGALYYLTDAGAEFQYLMKLDLNTGDREKVLEMNWDISYAYFSHGGNYQVIGANVDGSTQIRVLDVAAGKDIAFPDFGSADINGVEISDDESLMRFYVGSSATPGDLYMYDLKSGTPRQLTQNLNAQINQEDLVLAEVVRYPSFDGLEIPAIYYRPKIASPNNKVPALVWVHGGPGGQSRQSYNPLVQYLVNQGYAVLAVNNRGSSGYGKTFYQMDDRNHGEKDLQDCVYGKYWLAEQDYIDPEKIGIIGGSYGGFMVMRALTAEPDAFEVGVNIYGVTNWQRTLKNIPPWWESFKDALYTEMGNPYEDSLRLYQISPLFHADKITKPVMVLQGSQDPRVLQVESDEIVEAARQKGVPVEYVLFPDEGHGFVKKENQIEAYSKIVNFLDVHLKKKPALLN